MCRQVGIILGRKRRRFPEHDILLDIFTEMLWRSERGGPHATGVAVLREDGAHVIAKRPLPARRFIDHNAFFEALTRFDNKATAIIGHTRWRTRGTEKNNRNNHPIRAGQVIGTHNGTIYNADDLFRRLRLMRGAEVDSELLFRLADAAVLDGTLDAGTFLRLVGPCRGQIGAVLAAVGAPGRVVVLKGNKPLEFRYSRRHRAVAYATDAAVLDDAIDASYREPHDWRPMVVEPMTMLVFRHEDIFAPEPHRLAFVAQTRQRAIVSKGITP
jgi:glucosamine 6-phosphate synthetase-like amidotransferase/phosphosugar isomerase protein